LAVEAEQLFDSERETALTCERCTLQYTIYGVFAFCPDCAAHNSLQILKKNFEASVDRAKPAICRHFKTGHFR
jgi:hypothetical protein